MTANLYVFIKHGKLISRSQIGYQITIPENFHPNQKFTQRKMLWENNTHFFNFVQINSFSIFSVAAILFPPLITVELVLL